MGPQGVLCHQQPFPLLAHSRQGLNLLPGWDCREDATLQLFGKLHKADDAAQFLDLIVAQHMFVSVEEVSVR